MPDVSCAREGDPVNRTQFRYNAPLDGMRGVLMVFFMLYHFGVGVFSGAWVSINTFFVLSGFLITRLLVEEHARTGRIRVWEFYKRRARRLLPALFLLLTTIAGYAAFVAPESARRVLGGDILATLGYVINWRLIARADEYFGTAGGPSPLRHAWTLSIEEQFYVLVPFLIGAVVLLARRRRSQAMIVLALAGIGALWGAHLGLHDVADHARPGSTTARMLGPSHCSSARPSGSGARSPRVVGCAGPCRGASCGSRESLGSPPRSSRCSGLMS